MTVSVCLIAHNEEENLDETLSKLGWAGEIIVVDCASTDGTAEIARRYTDRVYSRPNDQNLNVNKNFSFDQATSDWILCLDADERVTGQLAEEIGRTIASGPPENGFFLRRKNTWFGRVLMHGGHFPDRQLRLFRRGSGRFPERHVHERLAVDGKVGTLQVPLEHFPYGTLSQYLEKMDFYTTFEASSLREKGMSFSVPKFLLGLLSGKWRFFRRYVLKGGFLDGWQGFAAAGLDFFSRMITLLKLLEMEKKEAPPPAP